jgi:hypothetical protein
MILNTLGVAQYRAGLHKEAVETLAAGSLSEDLAFLAMAHHQLGQREKAREFLKMLRDRMKRDVISSSYRAFLAEAEALIEGPPK